MPTNPSPPPFPTAEGLTISDERRAHLAPKLRALLDDFRRLEELEAVDLEPAMTGAQPESDDDADA